jgi:hypothetical protein
MWRLEEREPCTWGDASPVHATPQGRPACSQCLPRSSTLTLEGGAQPGKSTAERHFGGIESELERIQAVQGQCRACPQHRRDWTPCCPAGHSSPRLAQGAFSPPPQPLWPEGKTPSSTQLHGIVLLEQTMSNRAF